MHPAIIRSSPAAWSLYAGLLFASPAAAQDTIRVSVDSNGLQANGPSDLTATSSDGRHVAFVSLANNLDGIDSNLCHDVFVHDRQTGRTSRVSLRTGGEQGNRQSGLWGIAISGDGHCVAFASEASNLVAGDNNTLSDVFVHDRATGDTTRVSVDSAGGQANSHCSHPSISADGRFVAFYSGADNLVPGDTNSTFDVFVHDRVTGETSRVSLSSAGVQGNLYSMFPSISADGNVVAFYSDATNLVPADTNTAGDIFIHDRSTGLTTRVSVDSAGAQANWYSFEPPALSADGIYVAFFSLASNLVAGDTNNVRDVFVHDRLSGATRRVSVSSSGEQADKASWYPTISGNGRYVAFQSDATNLVLNDGNSKSDAFVHDMRTGQTRRVSVDTAGLQGDGGSLAPWISADGRAVAFSSLAANLVANDTNAQSDVFVHDLSHVVPSLVSVGTCPGPVTLTVFNSTAGGKVAIACGAAGAFTRAAQPCAGIPLGVTPPALVTIRTADAEGTAVLSFTASAGLCGLSVQAVDAATCTATNVIVL